MRRTIETLFYSNLKYNVLHVCPEFRERIFNETDQMLFEPIKIESDVEFRDGIELFKNELEQLSKKYKRILLQLLAKQRY